MFGQDSTRGPQAAQRHPGQAQARNTEDERHLSQRRTSAVLYVALTGLALWVLGPFIPAVVWALVIAIALWPALTRLQARGPLRGHGTVVAIGLTLAVTLLFVLPLAVAITRAAGDAGSLMNWVRHARESGIAMPEFLSRLPWGAQQVSAWWQANLAGPLHESPFAHAMDRTRMVAATRWFGTRALHTAITFGFTIMSLFFVLRAGPTFATQLLGAAGRLFGADGALLTVRMVSAVRSTVTGLVVVGMGEGALLGIAYLFTGVPHAFLLGVVSAIAAMLPFCAPVIFIAASLWLLAAGSTVPAMLLLACGFIIVFVAEHFVRPVLIGGSTRLPFLLVLFGILGGAETFGLLGIFIGPALMTILMVLWNEWACERA
jgi:predicted PurR-regulated permease PerM